jgi:hypothetical protein
MRFHALDQMWGHIKKDLPGLSPCPFCGCSYLDLEGLRQVSVVCSRCKAEGPESTPGAEAYDAIREAVHKWNSRIQDAANRAIHQLTRGMGNPALRFTGTTPEEAVVTLALRRMKGPADDHREWIEEEEDEEA